MVSYNLKRLYYNLFTPLMAINGKFYQLFQSPNTQNKEIIKVQLGPGQRNYLPGFINVDSNFISAKTDVWADISKNIPFKDESIDFIYSHHVIEHLTDLALHFQEVYRTLKKGGKIRIGAPNGDNAIKKFIANDMNWFPNFPDERKSIGGKFENFIFCRKEHLTIITESYLIEILENIGFKNISFCLPTKDTKFPDFVKPDEILSKEWESDFEFPHTIIVEAEKI